MGEHAQLDVHIKWGWGVPDELRFVIDNSAVKRWCGRWISQKITSRPYRHEAIAHSG